VLEVGFEFPSWVLERVDEEAIHSFATVLGDPNPIHLDRAAVQRLGLGDAVINQGPAGIGYIMSMIQVSVPDARIEDLQVSLFSLIFGGDRVVAAGRVNSAEVTDGTCRYGCSVWLDTMGGRRAIEGTASLLVTLADS
jgi:hypothetical protein